MPLLVLWDCQCAPLFELSCQVRRYPMMNHHCKPMGLSYLEPESQDCINSSDVANPALFYVLLKCVGKPFKNISESSCNEFLRCFLIGPAEFTLQRCDLFCWRCFSEEAQVIPEFTYQLPLTFRIPRSFKEWIQQCTSWGPDNHSSSSWTRYWRKTSLLEHIRASWRIKHTVELHIEARLTHATICHTYNLIEEDCCTLASRWQQRAEHLKHVSCHIPNTALSLCISEIVAGWAQQIRAQLAAHALLGVALIRMLLSPLGPGRTPPRTRIHEYETCSNGGNWG